MQDHSETTSLDTPTAAAVWRRLSESEKADIEEVRLSRLFVETPLVFLRACLGPTGNGIGNYFEALRPALRHLRDILAERDADEFAAEVDRLNAVEAPIPSPLIEVPRLRKRSGPYGHDDRRNLLRMRELLGTRYDVRGPWTAASMIVGRDDKDRIKGLRKKYVEWEADGFPVECVPEESVRG